MSASIPSLLADKLDVSEEKAKKLLLAMLREVKKRAFKEGVRLPEFGTFREHNGTLTFEPSPALARAVNRQFEGLESEDLETAPSRESDDDSSDDGPDTITLGYQDSDWTPLDSEESSDEEEASDDASGGDDESDTAEFEVPSADEAADTDELQPPAAQDNAEDGDEEPSTQEFEPEPTAESSTRAPDSDPSGGPSTETEELYPLVEDVPAGAEEEDEEEDEKEEPPLPDREAAQEKERSSLSGIWNSEEDSEAPSDEPSAPSESEHIATAEPAASSEPTDDAASPSASPDAASTPDPSEADPSPDAQEQENDRPPDATEDPSPQKSGSTGARVLVGALVVLLLGGAGWYLLGQRGLVPPPQRTVAQLQSQIRTLPLVGSTAQPPEAPTDQTPDASSSSETAPAPADDPSDPASDGGDDMDPTTPSVTPSDEPASTSDADAPSSSQSASSSPTLTPSTGGWTVIVGSRNARAPAESLVDNYQSRFPNRDLPVGVLTGNVDGETRYRIGVGQFSSQSDAQRFIEEAGDTLPDGAWILQL